MYTRVDDPSGGQLLLTCSKESYEQWEDRHPRGELWLSEGVLDLGVISPGFEFWLCACSVILGKSLTFLSFRRRNVGTVVVALQPGPGLVLEESGIHLGYKIWARRHQDVSNQDK